MKPLPRSTRIARAIVLPALLGLAASAAAQEASTPPAPQWWGNVNLVSHHFGDEDDFLAPGENFNQSNYGLGVEVQWQPRHAVSAGYYRNSVDEDSYYALYHYTPFALGDYVRLGGMLGVVTGYPGYNDGGLGPAAGLVAKIEGRRIGANLIYLPRVSEVTPHTLGLQFKVRFGP